MTVGGAAVPLFSIVTISYNQARYLDECIDSVAAQRADVALEHIVVDPGSTDGSRELLRRRAGELDRLVLEPDAGPGDGLNKGFAMARGSLLGYVNSDDRLAPGALGYAAGRFAARPDLDVLCGAIRIVDGQGRVSMRKRTSDPFDLTRYAAGICTVGQQATFFRRRAFDLAGGFNAANRVCWDGELLVDMALAGASFESVRRVLGDFRVYPASITGSGKFVEAAAREYARIAARIREGGVTVWPPAEARLRRLAYKLDPLRHIGYYTVR
jgi:glycosyltransferase involved in cell wall biosynthesis